MATGSYTYNYASSQVTTSSSTAIRLNYIGTRMSGLKSNVRNNVPKFANVNSATCTVRIKRDGTSDLKMYNHDAAWVLFDEAGSITNTLDSKKQSIARSFTTFTYDALSYINSKNENAGVATSIYCLSFKASGDLSKKYTYDNYNFKLTYTLPTITINGNVNNSSYGAVVSDTHTLGSPIDIGAVGVWGTQTCKLTAKPKTGYRFVKWDDGETNATRDVVLSEDVLTAHNTTFTYKAVFEPIKYNITVTASPAEGGQSASIQAQHGTEIILQAIANEGYKFVKWSDGNTDAIRTVIATSDANYTAEFAPIMFAVATDTLCDDGTAGGIVTGGGSYAAGASVTLTAIPNEGYEFVQWDDGSTDPNKVFTATADLNFMAEFRVLKFTITTQAIPEGAGGVTAGGTYNWGTIVVLEIAIVPGYRFVKWSDGVTSPGRTVRVTEDATYIAIFEPENPKQIYIGTSLVKSVYYSAATNTITFVIDEVSDGTDVVGTVDGYHLAISNTAPTDAIEVAGVYVGTKQVHSS